jgi:hypothetical protein
MGQGRKGRSPDQILKDRSEIARLYLQGLKQHEIGSRLGLSRQQIGYDLAAIREEWLQSSLMDFNTKKAEELAQIDCIRRESWAAWEASKEDRETSVTEQIKEGEAERVKASIRKVEQTGDPRYLAGVQWCVEQRCKVLGLNAPVETRLSGADGGPLRFSVEAAVQADRELEEALRANNVRPAGGDPVLDRSP